MGGLREKRKRESREKILKAARDIFFTSGYENATIEQIAESAEIGVGTVYNYFKTKADILISVVEEEVDMGGTDERLIGTDLEKGIVEIILDFTWRAMGKMMLLSKRIWKELFAAIINSMKSDRRLIKGISSIDYSYIEKLKALLNDLKARNALPDDFDAGAAAMVIYGILMTQAMLYVFGDDMTLEQMKREIENQIRFVFEGKCNGREGAY